MRRIGLACIMAFGLSAGQAQAQDSGASVKVVVVPIAKPSVPDVKSSTAPAIEKVLRKHAIVLPFHKFVKAAIDEAAADTMTTAAGAVRVARQLNADFVVLLSAVPDGKRRGKKTFQASVNLLDVKAGQSVLNKRYPFKGSSVPTKLSVTMANELARVMMTTHSSASLPPLPDLPLPSLPSLAPLPDAPDAGLPAEPDLALPPMPLESPPLASPPAQTVQQTIVFAAAPHPRLRLAGGVLAFQRSATLDVTSEDVPPCYCVPEGIGNPLFGGGVVHAEFYPLWDRGADNPWYTSFGLHLDSLVGMVKTSVPGGDTSISLVSDVRVGATYRWITGARPTSPDVQFRAGYGFFNFPLRGAAFPGVNWKSPHVGVMATVPMGPIFSFLLNGALLYPISIGNNADRFGAFSGGTGFNAGAGIRITVTDLEVTAQGLYQQFNLSYTGPTHFTNTSLVFHDVSVTDHIVGGTLTVGFTF